jgi:predicted type IV restriction endonuclease
MAYVKQQGDDKHVSISMVARRLGLRSGRRGHSLRRRFPSPIVHPYPRQWLLWIWAAETNPRSMHENRHLDNEMHFTVYMTQHGHPLKVVTANSLLIFATTRLLSLLCI